MKRKRSLIILLLVFVVLCGVIAAEKLITRHVDKIREVDEVVFTCDPAAVTALKFTEDSESLELVNKDGAWVLPDDAAFPVSREKLSKLFDRISELHVSFVIDDVDDFAQYGLKKPTAEITVTSPEGERTVALGAFSSMDGKRYISVGDGRAFLIDEDLINLVYTDRNDVMQHDSAPEKADKFVSLKISGDTSLNAVKDEDGVYSYTDAYNYYDISDGGHLALKDSNVETAFSDLRGLALTDWVTYTASSEDLSQYGLDKPERMITVTGTDSSADKAQEASFTLDLGAVRSTDENGEEKIDGYLRYDGSEIVYRLTDDQYKKLSGLSRDSLRPSEVFSLDRDDITSIEVRIEGETYEFPHELRPEHPDEELSRDILKFVYDGEVVNIDPFLKNLDDLRVDEFDATLVPEKQEEIAVTINLSNEDYPSLDLVLYRYDGKHCIAVYNGETLGLVYRTMCSDLREDILSFILDL